MIGGGMTNKEIEAEEGPSAPATGDFETPFQRDLSVLLNRHSQELGSGTPDFILAQFLRQCLDAFNGAVNRRAIWYYGEDGEQVVSTRSGQRENDSTEKR